MFINVSYTYAKTHLWPTVTNIIRRSKRTCGASCDFCATHKCLENSASTFTYLHNKNLDVGLVVKEQINKLVKLH